MAPKPYSSEKRDLIQKKILENPQAGKFRPSAVDAIQRKCAACEREDAIQRKEDGQMKGKSPFEIAASGFSSTPARLPHLGRIQKSFGRDMSHVEAFVGGRARMASRQLGATAYTSGNRIAFADNPSLELAAHEAAHVVQQQSGKVQLKGGVGEVGDEYERHADAVADLVVQGKSAASLLGEYGGDASSPTAQVQLTRLFRGMIADRSRPAIGRNARKLGVRISPDPNPDVDVELRTHTGPTGPCGCGYSELWVIHNEKGMSVAPDTANNLPRHRRSPAFGGTGKDPVWSIDSNDLGFVASLAIEYHQDSSKHGVIRPKRDMPFSTYENSLKRTRNQWLLLAESQSQGHNKENLSQDQRNSCP